MNTWAVILAAGRSSRMGELKQLLPWRGQTILECSLAPYLEVGLPVVVVLGYEHGRIEPVLAGLPVRLVVHSQWSRGMGSSLAAGVKALGTRADRLLVGLGDMPEVSPSLVRTMLAVDAPTACPVHRGRRGHPVLFERSFFAELARLDGDRGARHLMNEATLVEWPTPECLRDVDTPADYSSP